MVVAHYITITSCTRFAIAVYDPHVRCIVIVAMKLFQNTRPRKGFSVKAHAMRCDREGLLNIYLEGGFVGGHHQLFSTPFFYFIVSARNTFQLNIQALYFILLSKFQNIFLIFFF